VTLTLTVADAADAAVVVRRERPIPFSGAMIRAILEGRKTVTRRVVKFPRRHDVRGTHTPLFYNTGSGAYPDGHKTYTGDQPPGLVVKYADGTNQRVPSPYGLPGDRLWVRETHVIESNVDAHEDYPPPFTDGRPTRRVTNEFGAHWSQAHYRATDPAPDLWYDDREGPFCRWRPSIFMPRWASRFTLEVTAIGAEPLQNIDDAGAESEGCGESTCPRCGGATVCSGVTCPECRGDGILHPRDQYRRLWDSLNAKRGYGWDGNPWVWVVAFTRSRRHGESRLGSACGPRSTLRRRRVLCDVGGR
jgi:hypothetical protein